MRENVFFFSSNKPFIRVSQTGTSVLCPVNLNKKIQYSRVITVIPWSIISLSLLTVMMILNLRFNNDHVTYIYIYTLCTYEKHGTLFQCSSRHITGYLSMKIWTPTQCAGEFGSFTLYVLFFPAIASNLWDFSFLVSIMLSVVWQPAVSHAPHAHDVI